MDIETLLEKTMRELPQLGHFGMGVYDWRRKTPQQRSEDLAKNRERLREDPQHVGKIVAWLENNIVPRKTINTHHSSYGLKHIVENEIGYVANGQFIAAAIIAGYTYKVYRGDPNVRFGMSEKSIKAVEVRQGRR